MDEISSRRRSIPHLITSAGVTGVVLFLALPATPSAQRLPAPSTTAAPVPPSLSAVSLFDDLVIPAGQGIEIELDSTVSSAKNKFGDSVAAHITRVVNVGGIAAIPAGTPIRGTVTFRSQYQPPKQIGVQFRTFVFGTGREFRFLTRRPIEKGPWGDLEVQATGSDGAVISRGAKAHVVLATSTRVPAIRSHSDDEWAIRQVLATYAEGSSKSVLSVFPSVDSAARAGASSEPRLRAVSIVDARIAIVGNGEASVAGTLREVTEGQPGFSVRGPIATRSTQVVFTLRKVNGNWQIAKVSGL